MLKNILLIWAFLWMYRYIGVLLYRLRYAGSDFESTQVSYPHGLNLFRSIVAMCIQKIKPSLFCHLPSLDLYLYDFSKSYWQSLTRPSKSWFLYILASYKEIYFWPWIKISPYFVRKIKYLKRIWWIDERKCLKRSDWQILCSEVRQNVRGVQVLGVRKNREDEYKILLKLPKRASKIFGLPSPDGVFLKFREETERENLRICLKPYRHSKTKKVIIETYQHPRIIYKEANFCGQQWRRNFITFLRKVTA